MSRMPMPALPMTTARIPETRQRGMRIPARMLRWSAGLLALCAGAAAAQDFSEVCHASSQWDMAIAADGLRFERAAPAPRRVEMRDGELRLDGQPLPLAAESVDRLVLFEHDLRALVPQVKAVAREGVQLAQKALRAEVAALRPSAAAQRQVDAILMRRAGELERRIDASMDTRDWSEDALRGWIDQVAGEVVAPLASDLGAQAMAAVAEGDLATAADLHARAADVGNGIEARLERRLQALRPRVEALCPSIRRLAGLQQGLRDADRKALDLLTLEPSP